MANEICKCGDGLSNTGLPLCTKLQKVIKKIVFVQLTANDGTLNKIDPATTLNKAWVDALLNHTDTSKRWYPTPEMKNITSEKDDADYETYEDDSMYFIKEKPRKFTGLFPATYAQYKSKLEAVRCVNNTGVYMIDVEGNIIGLTNGSDGYLYPMPISAQSLYAKVNMASDKTTASVALSFEFLSTMQDGLMRMVTGSAFTDFSPLSISGLYDGYGVVSGVTTTGFTLKLTGPSSALDQPNYVQGLLAANFALKEVTPTPGTIVITSVTETSKGTYVFVIPAQTTGDKLSVTPTLTGFDFSTVPSVAITIP